MYTITKYCGKTTAVPLFNLRPCLQKPGIYPSHKLQNERTDLQTDGRSSAYIKPYKLSKYTLINYTIHLKLTVAETKLIVFLKFIHHLVSQEQTKLKN
jgi:hypothetical protein